MSVESLETWDDVVESLRPILLGAGLVDPELARAFAALTPGRRREYHLHVSSAKQSATRARRVDQHVDRIRAGKGLRDR